MLNSLFSCTIKYPFFDSSFPPLLEQQRLVAYLGGLQSRSREELRRRRALLPSILDKAFKGEL
jgi:hypothetical protein